MKEKHLIRTDSVEFPGNSQTSREEKVKVRKPSAPSLEKQASVVKNKMRKRQKSLGEKITETFFPHNETSIGEYIIHDVLIPSAKDILSDVAASISDGFISAIELQLFGEVRHRSTTRSGRGTNDSRVSYTSYYAHDRGTRREQSEPRRRDRGRYDFRLHVFATRGEAEEVLSDLVDLTIDYQAATVAAFYELCGLDTEFTDNKYGWTNLRDAYTDRVREGYVLRLPQPKPLD